MDSLSGIRDMPYFSTMAAPTSLGLVGKNGDADTNLLNNKHDSVARSRQLTPASNSANLTDQNAERHVGAHSVDSSGDSPNASQHGANQTAQDDSQHHTDEITNPNDLEQESDESHTPDADRARVLNQDLSPEELKQISQLKQRDAEVRAHEQAHISASGGYALGGATYSYQTGPDNRRYAIGGEVKLDTSPLKDPEATIAKMAIIRRAALAPAEPSAQDRRVALYATQEQNKAQLELMELLQSQQQQQGTVQINSTDLTSEGMNRPASDNENTQATAGISAVA